MGRVVHVEPGLQEKERLLHTLGGIGGGERDRGRRVRRVVQGLWGGGRGVGGRGERQEETEERRGGIEDVGKRGEWWPIRGGKIVGGKEDGVRVRNKRMGGGNCR